MQNPTLKRELGVTTAIFVVMASMIGTGIFGNTGLVQAAVADPLSVIALWAVGGVIAICGALSYAELAAMMPHAGGEYVYIKNIFGALLSFLTGWVSFTVAFAAQASSSALLSGVYLFEVMKSFAPDSLFTLFLSEEWNRKLFATAMVAIFAAVHMLSLKKGGILQNMLTSIKVSLLSLFVVIAVVLISWGGKGIPAEIAFASQPVHYGGIGFGLIMVMLAYSGWNGATYLAEEIKSPDKNVPRALLWGTSLTMVLYLFLNIIFYFTIPLKDLSGNEALAAVSAINLFGPGISLFFNLAFMLMLFASVSVSIMLGPRVFYAMGRDHLFFKFAGEVHQKYHTPVVSILLQVIFSMIYIFTGTYGEIQNIMGFALMIFPIVAVVGLLLYRRSHPDVPRPYQTPLYPLIPILFIVSSLFVLVASFMGRPLISLKSLGIVLLGVPVYFIWIGFFNKDIRIPTWQKNIFKKGGTP